LLQVLENPSQPNEKLRKLMTLPAERNALTPTLSRFKAQERELAPSPLR